VGAHNRAVHHAILHIGILSEMLQHSFPHPVVTPAGKPLIHTIPVPVLGGQQAPLRSTPVNPDYPFDKKAALGFLSNIGAWVGLQKIPYFRPLFICQFYGCHPTTLPEPI
jgi:hypothetical protein